MLFYMVFLDVQFWSTEGAVVDVFSMSNFIFIIGSAVGCFLCEGMQSYQQTAARWRVNVIVQASGL